MGWAEGGINRSSHPRGCKGVRQRLCQPKQQALAWLSREMKFSRVPVPLPSECLWHSRGAGGAFAICGSVPLTDVPRAHLLRPRPSCCLGTPGKAGRREKPKEKLMETGRAPRVPPERAGRQRRARFLLHCTSLHHSRTEPAPQKRHREDFSSRSAAGIIRHHHAAALPPSEPEKAQSQAELPHRIRAQGQPAAPPSLPPAGTAEGTECSHPQHPLWIPGAARRDLRG